MRRFGPNKFRLLGAVALLGSLVVNQASAQLGDASAEAFLRNSQQATPAANRDKSQNRSRLNLFEVRQNETSKEKGTSGLQVPSPAPSVQPPVSSNAVPSDLTLTGPTPVDHGIAKPLDYPNANLEMASPIDLTSDSSSRRVMQQPGLNPWGDAKPATPAKSTRIVQLPEPPRGRLVQRDNTQAIREAEDLSSSNGASRPSDLITQGKELESQGSNPPALSQTAGKTDGTKSLAPIQSQRLARNITVVSVSVSEIGNGSIPEDQSAGLFGANMAMPSGWDRAMIYQQVHWQPSLVCHYPLYFEDAMLERHGHVRWGCLQSAAAGAKFFATIPMLPYLYTLQNPCECQYAAGHYRAGSCAPALRDRLPYDRNAMVVEALSCAGFFWAMPL